LTHHPSQTLPAGGIQDHAAGGLLHIDLDALAANWRSLRDRSGGATC